MRSVLATWMVLAVVAAPLEGAARVSIEAQESRSYRLPGMFAPRAASHDAAANGTLWFETVGAEQSAACVVILVDEKGARSLSFRHDDKPTVCREVIAHPKGGFLVRAEDPTAAVDDVTAVVARVSQEGAVLWTTEDRELLDAGEIRGVYAGALPSLLYSGEADRVLSFTAGTLSVGGQLRSLSLVHALDGRTGSIEVLGQAFGNHGLGVAEGGMVRDDGDYVLHFRTADMLGTEFYTYNGRNQIDVLKPLGEDAFSDRVVIRMRSVPGEPHALLLSSKGSSAQASIGLSLIDEEGRPFWTQMLETQADGIELGRPLDVFWGKTHSVVTYRVLGVLHARVLRTTNGEVLGTTSLEGVVNAEPAAIVQSKDGTLRLLAMDKQAQRAREYVLSFEDLPDEPMEPEPDMGMDMEPMLPVLEPVDPVALACGCRQVGGAAPGWKAVLLLLGGVMFGRRRRKPTCALGPAQRG